MGRVQGIGGIFFQGKDPQSLQAWYGRHLGISPLPHSPWGPDDDAPLFEWRDKDNPDRTCFSVFNVASMESEEFQDNASPFMFNFRVADLDALLTDLRTAGVRIDGEIRSYPYGRFVHIFDPEGNKIELWEPAEGF